MSNDIEWLFDLIGCFTLIAQPTKGITVYGEDSKSSRIGQGCHCVILTNGNKRLLQYT